MFDLCTNPAVSRTSVRSKKQIAVKITKDEDEVIKEMMAFYNEQYSSNILRLGLKKLYDDMLAEKNNN